MAGTITPEVGKVYRVMGRKGTFWAKCLETDGEGGGKMEIVAGVARYMSGGGYSEGAGHELHCAAGINTFVLEDAPEDAE